MSEDQVTKILGEITDFRYKLRDLETKLDDLEKDIKSEFTHNLQKVEWEHQVYDRRISFTEKILFGAVGIILVTVLGALLATVIVK